MRITHWTAMVAAIIVATSYPQSALAAETGEMRLEKGYTDPETGIRVEDIVVSPTEDMQEVHLSVPKSGGPIEEVIVRAQRQKVPQRKPYVFLRDYDHEHYGLVIYLGKNPSVPVRLYLDARQDAPGAVTP